MIGHAKLARKGISLALSDLVKEKWITENDAIEIAKMIMWKNAKDIYIIE